MIEIHKCFPGWEYNRWCEALEKNDTITMKFHALRLIDHINDGGREPHWTGEHKQMILTTQT